MEDKPLIHVDFINMEIDDSYAPDKVKYPRFSPLGNAYPHALEEKFERILRNIDNAWDTDHIGEVFNDLIIDKRGGRQGFPIDVMNDIFRLKEFSHAQKIESISHHQESMDKLESLGISLDSEQFMATVNEGDQVTLDLFLNAGFSFTHLKDDYDSSPLMIALKKGFTVCAAMLLMNGDYPNARDKLGLSPLLISCGKPQQGYRMISEQLIKKGANLNTTDPFGNTPLLLALSSGLLDIAILLIKHGANINITNKVGDTAMTLLQEKCDPSDINYEEVSKLLMPEG